MIKGRYVCQVEVDFEYDEDGITPGSVEYDVMRNRIMTGDWMEKAVKAYIEKIFESGNSKITVTRQYADITMEEKK